MSNKETVIDEFVQKGIKKRDIKYDDTDDKNVFTFNQWKKKGRFVRKGEKGVKLSYPVTFYADGNPAKFASFTVFHISQTKEIEEEEKSDE